jgi:hypothetical protein
VARSDTPQDHRLITESADAIHVMSQRTGISSEQQQLRYLCLDAWGMSCVGLVDSRVRLALAQRSDENSRVDDGVLS